MVGARCSLRAPTRCELATACHGICGELPGAGCERRTVADEIPAGNFDASSAVWKLKAVFGPETEHARCTGELCPVLFQLICDMGRVWNTDVQEIELQQHDSAHQQVSPFDELDAAFRARDDQKVDCPSAHSSGQVRVFGGM